MSKRKIWLSVTLFVTSLFLGGCLTAQQADIQTENPNITLTGTLNKAGSRFSLSIVGKPSIELDSRKINLDQYTGRSISVTGQYSGTTLFVDRVGN